MAFARTGKECTKESIELITSDIMGKHGDLPIETIIQALKSGGNANYDDDIYQLTSFKVMVWIRKYLEENPESEVNNSKYTYYRFKGEYYKNIRRIEKGLEIEQPHEIVELKKLGVRIKQW
jgi:hypothetical protein